MNTWQVILALLIGGCLQTVLPLLLAYRAVGGLQRQIEEFRVQLARTESVNSSILKEFAERQALNSELVELTRRSTVAITQLAERLDRTGEKYGRRAEN
ncbi:hypothetical protein [Candidatus Electronema sp. JM]|uniref:hypothetical protein n=1 Tax=Candidatus Electronema sp. JM TaxID=3401571 RepID=UPI003AA96504